jgi:hypothetical protein
MKILIEVLKTDSILQALVVNMDNDSFKENQAELSEIVSRQIPHDLKLGDEGKLKDSNGNTVGHWVIEKF